MVSSLVSFVYYDVYKKQIIESKIASLDDRIENLLLQAKHKLAYSKSYLRQKIDSKEASLIFNAKERGDELVAPFVTQFLNRFIDKESSSANSSRIVNDFVIFDSNSDLIIYINTQDPFAEPVLRNQTKVIIDSINDENDPNKKLSQYYYFLESAKDKRFLSFYIIEAFSPYQLTSKPFYDKNDDIYLVQAELNIDFIKKEIKQLINEYHGYLQYKFIDRDIMSDSLSLTSSRFQFNDAGFYEGGLGTTLFEIILTLDKNYFTENLNNFLFELLYLTFVLISLTYFILSWIIDKQIINPITSLAKSIKDVDVSSVVELKPLQSNDEVADLNESYISLINKINILANSDPLTGLANRGSFNKQLSSLENSDKENNTYIALFFIDLDNFKYVNDTFGHDAGDRLLVIFSQRLRQTLRSEDRFVSDNMINSIARLGGDEFVILMNGLPSLDAIKSIGQRICDLFKNGFTVDKNKFDVHASIGIAYSNSYLSDGEKLLNQADDAMYLAKRDGKNNFKLFSSDLEEKMRKEKMIESELNQAQDENELLLEFMPAYTSSTLELKGYEVLLRCPALTKLGIGPDVFIPIAEKTELILSIDLWVAERALMKLEEIVNKTGFKGFFSINVSSKSLRNAHFYTCLKKLIDKYKVNVKQIELEITETCLMPDDHKAVASLNKLKSLGVCIALDDFGTGYTSFSQLVNYPLDTLKIDRSFVKNLHMTPIGKKPTLDIIFDLAKVYQLEVIVEGVETEADFEHIKNLGCDIVQGYYFSKPRIWEDVINENCQLQQAM